MYEDKTPDALIEQLLENVDDELDKREGSVVRDLLYPAAIELSNAYTELDSVLLLGFAETTEGAYLDLRAGEFGLTRKPAVKALGKVTFNGALNGEVIPAGTRVMTGGVSPIYFVTLDAATISGGTALVDVEAEVGGLSGNIGAGEIVGISGGNLYNVLTATNTLAFDGGSDVESDEALLQRLKDRLARPATSGNASHYRQWALEVAGIGDAKVYPIANGPGTVKVVLVDTEKSAPVQTVIDAAKTHIESQMPIGVGLTVVGVTELPINISATITLEDGKTLTNATNDITTLVTAYLKDTVFTETVVRYAKIASLVIEAASVKDYANLLVNGGTANITLPSDNVAVTGTVTLT